MDTKRIEINGNSYDLNSITYDDIACRYGTGRNQVSGTGKERQHSYRIGVMTKIGDIEKEEWKKVVFALIHRDQESFLYESLKLWITSNCRWLKTAEERETYALDMFSSRIFDNELWGGFVAFNKRYRPHIFKTTNVVTVETVCGHMGEVTQAQVDQEAGKGKSARICCPECGRFVSFSVV